MALTSAGSLPRWAQGAGPVRPPLLVAAGLALSALAVLTYQALAQPYLGLDVLIERAVQAIDWGPLPRLFTALDWLEGLKQVAVACLGLLLVLLFRRRAIWLM